MELLAKLGIDWKLLIAQVVNFTILVGVLTYFIYRPLLSLLDERREKIRQSMEDVKRIAKQKEEMEKIRAEHLKNIDQEAGVMLKSAKDQAEKMKQEVLSSAQKEAAHILERGAKELADERARVFAEVQGSLAGIILSMTEKILQREFSPGDQARILEQLERDIPSLVR